MAVRATYGHVRRCDRIDMIVRVAGKEYTAAGFKNIYFKTVPEGRYEYYCRHSETSRNKIVSVKASKGFTVNFWGTIVTRKPIDFMGMGDRPLKVLKATQCE